MPDYPRSRPQQETAKFSRDPGAVGSAVRGADGAASDRRILFALMCWPRVSRSKAPVLPGPFCLDKIANLFDVIPGRVEDANPESRDSGSGPSDHPGMTTLRELPCTPLLPPIPRRRRSASICFGHPDPADAGDARGDRARRGGRRAGRRRSVRESVVRARRRLLGKEAAVFMPSGTMCNVSATLVHCRPGDEILAHGSAHIIAREGGAHAALGGFQITPLSGADGQFAPETLRAALHPRSRYQPPQTSSAPNKPPISVAAQSGRRPISTRSSKSPSRRPRRPLATHMDGARLLNATVATGVAARDMAAGWDSAWIDFSKGLGAPSRRSHRRLARFHR